MAVFSCENTKTLRENELAVLWNKSSEVLKSKLDPQVYTAWIKPLTVDLTDSTPSETESNQKVLELLAPNKFCRDHIKAHYSSVIEKVLKDLSGSCLSVNVKSSTVATSIQKPSSTSAPKSINHKTTSSRNNKNDKRSSTESNLNSGYNFYNFVVGPCNQFAHAASLKVSEQPGIIYNPLFVYGGVGLGKTHLVNAIGNAARRRDKKVLFVSSEYFVNELIHSLRTNNMSEFKSRFRSLDMLIIDDIQFIIGKECTQEEFFHTFNDLYQKRKQIIITSDKLPQELTGIEERLRTRFSSGLSADLQAPDFETRVAIIAKKAEVYSLNLPSQVAQYVAERINTNIRELEGALNRLQAMSSLYNSPINLELAEMALSRFCKQQKREFSIDQIQQAVASFYKVSPSDLLGKRRTSNVASARHVAMFLCRALTPKSYPEIGILFGGRDHSTVIHACKTIEDKIQADRRLNDEIESIKKGLS